MLAAIGLCLATTILLKMNLQPSNLEGLKSKAGKPVFALVTFVPLVWLLSVIFTAGVQKVWHPDPRIGFLAAAESFGHNHTEAEAMLHSSHDRRNHGSEFKLRADIKRFQTLRFNNQLDAGIALTFLALISLIIAINVREWVLLLAHKKQAELHESQPVWLPDYAVKEPSTNFHGAAGTTVLALGLAKELSGEAHLERAQHEALVFQCNQHAKQTPDQLYLETTENRFNGIRRCC
jgi:carbon starvation protein